MEFERVQFDAISGQYIGDQPNFCSTPGKYFSESAKM
jgi:hypothetical protein